MSPKSFVISQLVRYAQGMIAICTVWQGLAEHRWTDAQLAAFQARLGRIDYLPGLELALEGERANSIQILENMIHGRMHGLPSANETIETDFMRARIQTMVPRGMLRQNQTALLRFSQRYLDRVRDGAAKQSTQAWTQWVDGSWINQEAERIKRSWSPNEIMVAMLAPALAKVPVKTAKITTAVRMAIIACALERHRLAHGAFPETLDALAPKYLPSVPLDPMANQPFHYERDSDGWFQLYSVGPNGTDDGGNFASEDSAAGKPDAGDQDWPWPVPTRPAKRTLF